MFLERLLKRLNVSRVEAELTWQFQLEWQLLEWADVAKTFYLLDANINLFVTNYSIV